MIRRENRDFTYRIGDIHISHEDLLALLDRLDSTQNKLGLIKHNHSIRIARVVGAAQDGIKANTKRRIVKRAAQLNRVAHDLPSTPSADASGKVCKNTKLTL